MVKTIAEATKLHPEADFMVNFASFRSAYPTSKEALLSKTIRTVAIIAEGVPERRTKDLIKIAKEKNKWIIGPATVGGIAAGGFRIGNTAGMLDNIIASKLHRAGSVAYVSKSGGLSNELNNIIARNTDGVYEGVAIGGDRYPGSTFIDHLIRYEANPDIKMTVLLGEVGGTDEYDVVEALKKGIIKKPIVAWCIGTCSKVFPAEVQFGHAGARAGADRETADVKNKALKEAGFAPGEKLVLAMDWSEDHKRGMEEGYIHGALNFHFGVEAYWCVTGLHNLHLSKTGQGMTVTADSETDAKYGYNAIPTFFESPLFRIEGPDAAADYNPPTAVPDNQ